MMKISYESLQAVKYSEIPAAGTFLYNDEVYLKTNTSLIGGELSVRLSDGDTAIFSPTFKLKMVKCELTVTK